MKDDRVYLQYILECIRRIEEDKAVGYDSFIVSHLHQDAVLRNLHTLSETTQRISEPLKTRYPDVEWQKISAFRNVLVHDYLGVDVDRIWIIVNDNIPELKMAVEKMLVEISNGIE